MGYSDTPVPSYLTLREKKNYEIQREKKQYF